MIDKTEYDAVVMERDALAAAMSKIVEMDESFNGKHQYAAIARAALGIMSCDHEWGSLRAPHSGKWCHKCGAVAADLLS